VYRSTRISLRHLPTLNHLSSFLLLLVRTWVSVPSFFVCFISVFHGVLLARPCITLVVPRAGSFLSFLSVSYRRSRRFSVTLDTVLTISGLVSFPLPSACGTQVGPVEILFSVLAYHGECVVPFSLASTSSGHLRRACTLLPHFGVQWSGTLICNQYPQNFVCVILLTISCYVVLPSARETRDWRSKAISALILSSLWSSYR
jgi:hypothetical protein